MTGQIRKYQEPLIDFNISTDSSESSPEYMEIMEEINYANAITGEIIEQFAEIDSSIKEFKETTYKAASSLMDFSAELLEYSGKKSKSDDNDYLALAGLAVGAAGMITKGLGWGISAIRERRAERKKQMQIEALIEHKKEIASVKHEPIKKFREMHMAKIAGQTTKMYDMEFAKMLALDDTMLEKKTKMFNRAFGMLIKARFLNSTLDYALAEMEAWMMGQKDSSYKPLTMTDIIEVELKNWVDKLGNKGQSWDEFVKMWLNKDTESYPVAIASLFTNPTLFSNFVGLNLNHVDNCENGLITAEYAKLDIERYHASKLLAMNPYIIDCKENISQNWDIEDAPAGFGFADFMIIALPMIAGAAITFFTFMYLPGLLIRIIATAVSLCLIGFLAAGYFGEIDDLPGLRLPYIKREDAYRDMLLERIENIRKREEAFRNNNKTI